MHKALRKRGFTIGSFKVARLMKDPVVIAKIAKKLHFYPEGNEKHNIRIFLKDSLTRSSLILIGWGGLYYSRNCQGWLFFSFLDLHTREIVGYALSKTPVAKLAKKALMNAV